jgi:hypothetical protein
VGRGRALVGPASVEHVHDACWAKKAVVLVLYSALGEERRRIGIVQQILHRPLTHVVDQFNGVSQRLSMNTSRKRHSNTGGAALLHARRAAFSDTMEMIRQSERLPYHEVSSILTRMGPMACSDWRGRRWAVAQARWHRLSQPPTTARLPLALHALCKKIFSPASTEQRGTDHPALSRMEKEAVRHMREDGSR